MHGTELVVASENCNPPSGRSREQGFGIMPGSKLCHRGNQSPDVLRT
jgi:hypothetical protein